MGSVDGDMPPAVRCYETRLIRLAEEMLKDIDKRKRLIFQLNFGTLERADCFSTYLVAYQWCIRYMAVEITQWLTFIIGAIQ